MVDEPVLSLRTLNRTLLARQHLLERVERPVLDVVEHLVGMQAQLPGSPYVGLWSRIHGFDPHDLAGLLLDRQVVRMALMRSTIHLVSVDDALSLRPVVQPVLDWEIFRNRTWSRGIEGVDLRPVLAFGRQLVEERPRGMHEIRAAMAARWPGHDAWALTMAVRNLLPTFQVPPRGVWGRTGRPALTTLDHWTGRALATDPTPDRAIRRYLAAFGPATAADVGAWSRLTGMREPIERLRPSLRIVRDERGRELLDVPDGPLADPDAEAPVRFLPEFDNVLLSHQDRSRIIPAGLASVVRGRIGEPSLLVDGYVAGFWRLAGKRRVRAIEVEPIVPLRRAQRSAVEAEAIALLQLVAPGGELRFVDRP